MAAAAGRAVDGRAVAGLAEDGRAVAGRAVDGRAVDGRAPAGHAAAGLVAAGLMATVVLALGLVRRALEEYASGVRRPAALDVREWRALGATSAPLVPLDPRFLGAHLDGWSERELRCLPGLGRRRAADLVALRTARGGHLALDDWERISGIGATTVEAVRTALERRRGVAPPPDGQVPAP